MPCNIKNRGNANLSDLEPHVQEMYDYFDQKIGFNKPPTMIFDSDPGNQANVLGKTAYYDPSSLQIHIFVDGRHPKDMLRSIAHELIHHQQNLEGRLNVGGYHGEGYYLENEELKALEQEAMLQGNSLMREYEDNLKIKENNKMSLKEWKNNELNQLLMKRFGILKENADLNTGESGVDGDDKDETYMGHEKKENLYEDSGEEEKEHYDDDKMSDEDHIKAIEHHLRALKKDKDYDKDHEPLEEGGAADRPENKDKHVGEPGRGKRVNEAAETPEDPEEPLENPTMTTAVGAQTESLSRKVADVLKNNKKLKLRFK